MWPSLFAAALGAAALIQALPIAGRPSVELAKDHGLSDAWSSLSPRSDLEAAAEAGGFKRFEWVSGFLQNGDRLARSSAPSYNGQDSDQKLTEQSIRFLKQQGIQHVISLNSMAKSETMEKMLRKNGISYTPLPVTDYTAPSMRQLKEGYDAFKEHRSGTLVWCGYGAGRTGTMVSALQLYVDKEKSSPLGLSKDDFTTNKVERNVQFDVLGKLQRTLYSGPGVISQIKQGIRNVGNKLVKAFDRVRGNGGSARPKQSEQQPKASADAGSGGKPGPKPPKFVTNMWPDQAITKPVKGAPKQFGKSMTPNALGVMPKGPGQTGMGPLSQPGSKFKVVATPPGAFMAGGLRTGKFHVDNPAVPKTKWK